MRTDKTEYLSLRVNAELKDEFYSYCKERGFTMGNAIKLFVYQFAKNGELPFSLSRPLSEEFLSENTKRISIYMDGSTKKKFLRSCKKYGVPMSIILRAFMDYCVKNQCFPYDNENVD